ncbi:MAG: hypothetical protein OEZ37_09880, partial [Gemmatimonadota bacterium]|nr:hypothetical protein [Gemmatimonadota bacterium]
LVLLAGCRSEAPVGDDPFSANPALRQYHPPPPVRSYPATEMRINSWIAANQFDSMRAHGWDLWESITRPATSGLPIWETWYSGHELFVYEEIPLADERQAFRDFEAPHQLSHAPDEGLGRPAIPFTPHEEITSFNRFTEPTARYIWVNGLNRQDVLQDTLNALLEADVPIADQQVLVSGDSTDTGSIVLKVVWQFISGDSASLVPYWAGNTVETTTDTLMPIVKSWKQGMWLDPTGGLQPGDSVEGSVHGGPVRPWPVMSLDDFYSIVLDSADVKAFSRYALVSGDDVGASDSTSADSLRAAIRPGNVALLMAIHLTTKEIPNWTWHTYWWAMDPENPDYGDDRPASIPAPWNHYNQRAAYSMTVVTGDSVQPNVQWNPYLESNLTGQYATVSNPTEALTWWGPQTNCMSCHRMASFPAADSLWEPGYRPAMFIAVDDPAFAKFLKTDFLWSVAGRAGPPAGGNH